VAAIVFVAACSGSDDAGTGSGNASAAVAVDDPESLFDPANPEGTAPPVPGTAVVLDDDVIIATEDGEIPPTTTEPSIDPDGPDAPPVIDAPTTTAAPIPLPAPTDIGRIVSVSPTHTETLFALGLGQFVVGVDSESDFPDAALDVRSDDLESDSADLAPLLSLDPDVVIIGDDPTGLAQRLDVEGVASFTGPVPDTLDDVYAQILGIAGVVGRPDLGEDLVASMQSSVAVAVASLPAQSGRTYFHEIDPSLVTITPGNFLDSVYGELGLEPIVAPDPSGFTVVTSDLVVSADPDVIMLADVECCAVSADVLANRPGWSGLTAVSNGAVVELQDYMVMRWGPRVVDLVAAVAVGAASAG
jgi:iron complex transport system substrate-binding protein